MTAWSPCTASSPHGSAASARTSAAEARQIGASVGCGAWPIIASRQAAKLPGHAGKSAPAQGAEATVVGGLAPAWGAEAMLLGGPADPTGWAGPEGVDPAGLKTDAREAAWAWAARLHMGLAAGQSSMAGGPCLKSGPAARWRRHPGSVGRVVSSSGVCGGPVIRLGLAPLVWMLGAAVQPAADCRHIDQNACCWPGMCLR